jgi:hypothetical protein
MLTNSLSPRCPRAAALAAVALSLAAAPALASDVAAVRARPVKVEIGGTADHQSVTVRGVLSLAYYAPQTGYQAPRCGSIRWTCRSGTADQGLCRMVWNDIEAAARDHACVSFGALLWQGLEQAVAPYGDTPPDNPQDAHPYFMQASMGVVRIPCNPMPADMDRPDLSADCPAGPPPPPPDAAAPPDAPVANEKGGSSGSAGGSTGSGGATGAGGVTGAGGATATGGSGAGGSSAGGASAGGAAAGGAAGAPDKVDLGDGSGCSIGHGPRSGAALVVGGVLLALLRRRRRDA